SNCEHKSVSLYSVDRQTWKVKHVRDYEESEMGFCHGAKFYPYDADIFVATSYKPDWCVYFKTFSSGQIIYKISCAPFLPKDICFPADNQIIVIDCQRFPSMKPGVFYKVDVALFNFDFTRTGDNKHQKIDIV